jgi:hypothetical protein
MKKLIFLLLVMLSGAALYAGAFSVDYWIIQADGGVLYPVGDSANKLNLGFNGGLSGRKGLDNELSVGGGVHFMNMPYKDVIQSPGPFSATILNLEGVYAPYLPDFFIWPYIKAALGVWMVKFANLSSAETSQLSDQTAFGFQLGVGASYPMGKQFAATAEALFNQASVSGGTGDMYTFITFNLGITMYMK